MPAATAEEITELETRSAGLTDQLKGLGETLAGLTDKPADQRGDNWAREIRESSSMVYALDSQLQTIERTLSVEAQRSVREAMRSQGTGPSAAFAQGDQIDRRSMGQQLVDNDRFKEWEGRNHGSGNSGDIEIRTTLDEPTAGTTLWLPVATPQLPPQTLDRRRLFLRDIIASGTTTLSSIPYIIEHLPRTNEQGATTVAEGSAKPEVVMQFDRGDAPVRKIAAWIPATQEILEDAPTLRSYVDARLEYMVLLREEDQLLNGSGAAPDIRGIRQMVGLQLQTATAGDIPATIGNAIAKVEVVDGECDGLVMNPIDFWTMVITRHASPLDAAYGTVGVPSPYGAPPTTVWGLPTVRSRAMTAGKALVGAFRMGAQAFDRDGFVLRVGDQHADFFTNNKVAILGEKRVALAVYRPDWFVEATL